MGHDLLLEGFTVSQVVHDYGDVCQAITELAVQTDAPISADDFRVRNRCLDEAIAGAVTEYGRERNQSNVDELFRPFEQRSADRTGMGLGLAFSRWGVEANNGRVSARNLAETGCVFPVDLPRLPVATGAAD